MTDLAHQMVSWGIRGALLALVAAAGVAIRKRRVAKAEAAAPAPVEDPTQQLLRQAQHCDWSRDDLAAHGRLPEAVTQARAAADYWRQLALARPGRFQAERQHALSRLGELLANTGQAGEAERVRQESAGLA